MRSNTIPRTLTTHRSDSVRTTEGARPAARAADAARPTARRASRVPRAWATCLAAIASSVALLACGPDASSPPAPAATSGAHARRIVCGNAAATEFVCRLVDADRLAGLPDQADGWGSLDLRSHGFEKVPRFAHYTAEPVLGLAPDLVVTHAWQNADTTHVLRGRGIDVEVLVSATSYDDIRATMTSLGRRLGAEERAAAAVAELDARVKALRDGAQPRSAIRVLVYANNGTGGSTAGANTTPDTMLRLSGVRNAAADAGLVGHVNLDFERLIAIDPDFLLVSSPARGEGGSPTQAVVESSAALANLRARRPGRILVISPAWMSADSPPLVDAAEFVAREVDRVLAAEATGGSK